MYDLKHNIFILKLTAAILLKVLTVSLNTITLTL